MNTNICNGCGGVIGRDCYNPRECEEISRQNHNQDSQELEHLRRENSDLINQNTELKSMLETVKANLTFYDQKLYDKITEVINKYK